MKTNLTLHYAAGQGAYWMSYSAAIGYASVFLTGRGFSAGQIGLLMAGVNALGALIQPAVAARADRSATHTLNFYLRICQVFSLAAALVLCIGPHTAVAAAVCYVPLCVGIMTQQPLMNALAAYFIDRGQPVDYGKARGTGSICYAAFSYVLGNLAARFGSEALPYAVVLVLALLAALLSGYRLQPAGKEAAADAPAPQESAGALLRRYPAFAVLLVGVGLLFIGHYYLNTYLYQVVTAVGGTSASLGLVSAITAGIELPTMMIFNWLIARKSSSFWLRVSAVFFTAKYTVCLLAGSVAGLCAGGALQCLGFALYIPASVYYANEVMQPQDKVKGQALMTTSTVIGGLAGNLSGGWLLDSLGVRAMLLAGVVTALLGTAAVFAATRKQHR